VALFDLPIETLQTYRPDEPAPADFDAFWTAALTAARSFELDPRFSPADSGLVLVETYDVEFSGADGTRIRGWLHLPAHRGEEPLAAIVEFLGLGGRRGYPHQRTDYALAGYAHFVMDTRGQSPDSPDEHVADHGSATLGVVVRGIRDPQDYYYRRVYVDAARAIEAVSAHPAVDPARLLVAGISQGGGIAIAAASLHGNVAGALVDVPFLCHFSRAITITDRPGYATIAKYLAHYPTAVDDVRRTLPYFDGIHHAARVDAPALFSVALMDPVCPPSTVYAAYNAWSGLEKEIIVYPFNGHEGGEELQRRRRFDWLSKQLQSR
jgi:cephalosporin-C deacetylase